MKIYLAGGYGLTCIKGRERQVRNMMPIWRRLFSYHWIEWIYSSEILKIKEDENRKI